MEDFKLMNKQFYLSKILEEQQKLQAELNDNYTKIDSINSTQWDEKSYQNIVKVRRALHSRNKTIKTKLARLIEDYKRYSSMDI